MAEIIPLAIGLCGLTEQQMWTMTPAEISTSIEAHSREKMQTLRVFDRLVAGMSSLYCSAHGVENAKPADFLIFPPEPEKKSKSIVPVMGDSPEVMMQKLKIITVALGGTVT